MTQPSSWAPVGFTTAPAAPIPRTPGRGRSVPGGSALAEYRRALELHRLLTRDRRRRQVLGAGLLGGLAGLAAFLLVAGVTDGADPTGWLPTGVALLVAVGVAAALARRWTRPPQAIDAWRRGAAGERIVARQLDRLVPLGYHVLYDRALPGSGANVDALAVGPTGVFLVDAKNWRAPLRAYRGQVYAGRTHLGPVCAVVWFETGRTADALAAQLDPGWSIAVQPILALTGPRPPRGITIKGIPAVAARDLPGHLATGPARLSAFHVAQLAAAAGVALPPYPAPPPARRPTRRRPVGILFPD